MKKIFKFLLSLTLVLSLVACGGSESGNESSEDSSSNSSGARSESGVFTIAIDYMPESLQPRFGSDSITIMTMPIYDPLYQEVLEGVEYRLADSLDISEDGKTYTVHLNDDAIWSDGKPITTEDIEFSIAYSAYANGGISNYTHLDDEEIEFNIIDEKTFEMLLPRVSNQYISRLSKLNVIPAHPFEGDESKVDGSGYFLQPGMATSGAFEVVEVNTDSFVYEARDDYYRGEPQINTIVLKSLGSGSTRNIAMENGELSYCRVTSGEQLEKYKADSENFNVFSVPEARTNALNLNPHSAIFNSLDDFEKARQAIFLALDQEEIIMGAYGSMELAEPANSLMTPEQVLYNPDNIMYEQDIEEATRLAEESGLAGQTISYIYNRDRANMEEIATVIQQQLAQIGVNVIVEGLDNAGFWARYTPANPEDATDWELGTNGWDCMRGQSIVQFEYWMRATDRWGWSDEIVELTTTTDSETDPEREQELANELQQKTLEEYWFYPLPYPNFVTASHKNVTGLGESKIVPEFGDYLLIEVE